MLANIISRFFGRQLFKCPRITRAYSCTTQDLYSTVLCTNIDKCGIAIPCNGVHMTAHASVGTNQSPEWYCYKMCYQCCHCWWVARRAYWL